MTILSQTVKYRLSLIKYAAKYGATKAAIKYKTNRMYIYRWSKSYDGTLESLVDRSSRPHGHKNQHTEQELKLIKDMRKRNPHLGLVVFWVKLRMKGYKRSIAGLYRSMKRQQLQPVKPPNPKYVAKPYEQMQYPGQRVQIDVKHVPSVCLVGDLKGHKVYQYTAIDEFSRFRYVEAFDEASTYTSTQFLKNMLKAFRFKVECIQTDNGFEFTNRFGNGKPTLFENAMQVLGIRHKLIRPYTPRHNGKVERSHRKDNEYFYAVTSFYSFDDFSKRLKVHNRKYNNFPMRPIGWISPKEKLASYFNSKSGN